MKLISKVLGFLIWAALFIVGVPFFLAGVIKTFAGEGEPWRSGSYVLAFLPIALWLAWTWVRSGNRTHELTVSMELPHTGFPRTGHDPNICFGCNMDARIPKPATSLKELERVGLEGARWLCKPCELPFSSRAAYRRHAHEAHPIAPKKVAKKVARK